MGGSRLAVVWGLFGALAACTSDVKEQFLADLDIGDGGEVTDGTTAGDALAEVIDGTSAPTDTTAPSDATVTDATAADSTTEVVDTDDDATAPVDTSTPTDAITTDIPSASDVDIPPEALEAFGWRAGLPGLPIAAPFAFTAPSGDAVGLPVINGSAVELRTWKADGGGLWSATVQAGTAPTLRGGAACGDQLYVSAVEGDASKAYVARIDPSGTTLAQISFYPKSGTTGGSVSLGAVGCGGPGAYVLFEGVGAATYKAPGGGVVQLTDVQMASRSYIVDLLDTFSAQGTLGTVSADKIGIKQIAAHSPIDKRLFYVGEARTAKQLGETTLQPGDQLIYQHDYVEETGGTATSTGFFGDNDVRALAPAPDGRFAVVWRAVTTGEEQRVSAFDLEGDSIGVAVISKDAPITDVHWDGANLILAGTFTGAPPYPGADLNSGVWMAAMQVGAAMTVVRSAAFPGTAGPLGLHRVTLGGECAGDAWAVLVAQGGGVASVALADDGNICHSAALDTDDGAKVAAIDQFGNYVFATTTGIQLVRLRPGHTGDGL